MPQSRADRVAVVVGGLGRLGRSVTAALLAQGWLVITASRQGVFHAADGTQVGPGVDTTRPRDLGALAALAASRGRLLGWVNAAAVTGPVGASGRISKTAWQHTLSVNLVGPAAACAAALRVARPGAAIVNVSGGGATGPRPYVAAYAASKAGLVRHTENLAAELDGSGIRVNALAPGSFASQLWTSELAAAEGPAPAAAASARVLRRAAACAAWLLSDASRPLSGKLIAAQWDAWDTWPHAQLVALQRGDGLALRRQRAGEDA